MSARSEPRLSSASDLLVSTLKTLIKVPFSEAVANLVPAGLNTKQASLLLCALMMEDAFCFPEMSTI